MPELAAFVSLSECLTGERPLDGQLAAAHLARLQAAAVGDLQGLLARWQDARATGLPDDEVARAILADAALGPLARKVTMLWYTGGMKDAQGRWVIASAADYFGALAWRVVGSHAPGLSDQFFGHWKYPTER